MTVGQAAGSLVELRLYRTILREGSELKYLGLMLRNDCSWVLHWNYVKEKARRASFSVARLAGIIRLNGMAVAAMVKSVVRAILFYGVPVWAPP